MFNDKRITAVLVDTSVFIKANNDFLGLRSKLIPAFFSAIKEKDIQLLNHPILRNEMKKHISDTGLYKDFEALKNNIKKNENVISFIDTGNQKILNKIREYDLIDKAYQEYQKLFSNALILEYSCPETVFELYFSRTPPFSEKKKCEFPDAFVVESAKEYILEHYNDILMVISQDNDWKAFFSKIDNVIIRDTLEEALREINNIESIFSNEMIQAIFNAVYSDLLSKVQYATENECYDFFDYEFISELEVDKVEVVNIDELFTPLEIHRNQILIRTTATLKVAGHGEVIDDSRTFWDPEDNEYLFINYLDINFQDGNAEVEFEANITFEFDDLEGTAQIDSFQLCQRSGNIVISCDDVTETPISSDELAVRILREDRT